MIIIYIDIVLLVILLCLTVFTCGYCFYRVYTLQRNGQVTILLRPTKVLFSHKKEGEATEGLRTVVAYHNPFTGDYCVHKSRSGPTGYGNPAHSPVRLPVSDPHSPDSGVSDEYEPLHLDPPAAATTPLINHEALHIGWAKSLPQLQETQVKMPMPSPKDDNSVNKTWNWNYTEYQI